MTENFDARPPLGFPFTERFLDFSGRLRTFCMSLVDIEVAVCVFAVEQTDGDDAYEFQELSTSPAEAIAVLRRRIAKVLSVQHVSEQNGHLFLKHDRTHGRIVNGGVLIDRTFFTYQQFGELIQDCEGCQFDFKIVESSDELEWNAPPSA